MTLSNDSDLRETTDYGKKESNTKLRYRELSRKADIKRSYDPPGELSRDGKRHDNDFKFFSEIKIIPTKDEILCERRPFLPSSLPDIPHFLPDGVPRLLDTQFRLLREDMLNPIRCGISNFLATLSQDLPPKLSKEFKKIQEEGGRFTYNNNVNENGDLQVYSYAQFVSITCDRKKGLGYTIRFTPPKIRMRERREYWEKSKRLLTGSLVALLLPKRANSANSGNTSTSNSDMYSIYFGIVISRNETALAGYDHAEIDVNFIDPSIHPIALNDISNFDIMTKKSLENRFLVESTSVYLEAYYHILKSLQTMEPSSLPFKKYLAPDSSKERQNIGVDIKVNNPIYTRAPGFQFDLSVLCRNDSRSLKLDVADTITHNKVVRDITKYSNISKLGDVPYGLDKTQAEALISALTREIALIEGPPGTGKTVVGVQIMKVLLAKENKGMNIGPILTICFTNHALDQFLEHLLDENITKIVRLGSRTQSERIKEYTLDEICKKRPHKGKEKAQLHGSLESIEEKIYQINNALDVRWMTWKDIRDYLMINERKFFEKFNNVSNEDLPSWVLGANTNSVDKETDEDTDEESPNEFQTVRNNKNKYSSVFEQWLHGEDIRIINKRKEMLLDQQREEERKNEIKNKKKDEKKKKKKWISLNEFEALQEEKEEQEKKEQGKGKEKEIGLNDNESQIDYETIQWIKNYKEPKTSRLVYVLLRENSIWKMSKVERQKLHDYWRTKIRENFVKKLSILEKNHEEKRQLMNALYDEGNRNILFDSNVIGMTTNGAAKFQTLIKSIGPKIIICEEAGEVLEAHILSALTRSTQHLILIGDHNQLRPHIATYSLSMDSFKGKNYQLDKSLFERLVYGDKAVKIEKTQLLTQRRMRSEISDLIRYTLYPRLIDGENTAKYPNVRGVQRNVYFIDHSHPEDNSGGDLATKSHVNRHEVDMVVGMVNYFVRNGYTKPEDIAVLTPYLGQMIKIRDALSKSFVVVIDERDAQDIAEIEERQDNGNNYDMKGKDNINDGNQNAPLTKSLNQQVTLRTVDNFQGEEANIVIISLVRNFSRNGERDSIGFLKSSNRSNVLLSRAREGMYLIGNSELMSTKSENMWAPVIDILHKREQVGPGMPIVCNQHPNYKNIIRDPKEFLQVSPDGGCKRPCRTLLSCGHPCIYKCHSDDPEHIGINCPVPCPRFHPECNHQCPKRCFEDCGKCNVLIGDIVLPSCRHVLRNAECWQNKTKDTLNCIVLVTRHLPYCEHSKEIHCFESIYDVKCTNKCGKLLNCGHECLSECSECQEYSAPQEESITYIERIQHGECKHICDRLLNCGHKCGRYCHEGNRCPPCVHTDHIVKSKKFKNRNSKKYKK